MRLFKIFVGLLLVMALAVLMNKNSSQNVDIWLAPGVFMQELNLAVALVLTLAAGMIIGFSIGLFQIMSHQGEIRALQKKQKQLREELNTLRHSALDDDVFNKGDERTKVGSGVLGKIVDKIKS